MTPHQKTVPRSQGVFCWMLVHSSGGPGGNVDIATGTSGGANSGSALVATASSEESDSGRIEVRTGISR